MKHLYSLLSLLFIQTSLLANPIVFMTPIENGKTELLRDSEFLYSQNEKQLFEEAGISKYFRWIQTLRNENFLVHCLEGDSQETIFKKLADRISQKDQNAVQLQELYQEVLGVDLGQENVFQSTCALTEMLTVEIENAWDTSKEYSFVYPVLSDKKEKLLEMFKDKSQYFSDQVQELFRLRGIAKMQFWLQENSDRTFLVIYQEIQGPVTVARDKYLASKTEEISKKRSDAYSEITGLSYEELLPNLESLFDREILK